MREALVSLALVAIADELGKALSGNISAQFFVDRDLDPPSLTDALRQGHPLPPGQYSQPETALYDRALVETVRYVVGVAAELPGFQSAQAAQQLQRLSALQLDVGDILTRIKGIEVLVHREGVGPKEQRYEADYRQAIVRKFDTMELFGADIEPESRRHSLSVAFVSLRLVCCVAARGIPRRPGPSPPNPLHFMFEPFSLLPSAARIVFLVFSTMSRTCRVSSWRGAFSDPPPPFGRGLATGS